MNTRTTAELNAREALLAHGYLREDVREEMKTLAGAHAPERSPEIARDIAGAVPGPGGTRAGRRPLDIANSPTNVSALP